MNPFPAHVYKFDNFLFDPYALTLYHRGELIEDADKKTLQVLGAIIAGQGTVVTHDDILEKAWPDDRYGATGTRVNQYASRLQRLFTKYEPDQKFIKNVRSRGYLFVPEAVLVEASPHGAVKTDTSAEDWHNSQTTSPRARSYSVRRPFLVALAVVVLVIIGAAAFMRFGLSSDDDEAIRSVVRDSQMYESLVLYKEPANFTESDLDKYWTTELDINSNYDRARIRTAVEKLVAENRQYGAETKCERFDFQSVEVNANGDYAIAKTLESWFVALYQTDGTLIKNRNIGPYFVTYNLRKIDGRWLIERSTTGRATLAPPKLATIETSGEITAGRQFFVTLTGHDLLPQVVSIRVVGEGCPEANPCIVPNSALLKHSQLSGTQIQNIPLTLASGDFSIHAQNSEGAISNGLPLHVP